MVSHMKCQSLFSGKSKKRLINVSSAEFPQGVVKVSKYNPFISNMCFCYLPSFNFRFKLHVIRHLPRKKNCLQNEISMS